MLLDFLTWTCLALFPLCVKSEENIGGDLLLIRFVLCSLPSQSCPTPLTGSCLPTTWTRPSCIPALTSWGFSMWTSPGSSAEHEPCRTPPLRKPWRSSRRTTSTWAGWFPAVRRTATKLSEQRWKCSTRWCCCWQERKWCMICSIQTFRLIWRWLWLISVSQFVYVWNTTFLPLRQICTGQNNCMPIYCTL